MLRFDWAVFHFFSLLFKACITNFDVCQSKLISNFKAVDKSFFFALSGSSFMLFFSSFFFGSKTYIHLKMALVLVCSCQISCLCCLHCVPFCSGPFSILLILSLSFLRCVWVWVCWEYTQFLCHSSCMLATPCVCIKSFLLIFRFLHLRLALSCSIPSCERPWKMCLGRYVFATDEKCHCVERFITYIVLCQSARVGWMRAVPFSQPLYLFLPSVRTPAPPVRITCVCINK